MPTLNDLQKGTKVVLPVTIKRNFQRDTVSVKTLSDRVYKKVFTGRVPLNTKATSPGSKDSYDPIVAFKSTTGENDAPSFVKDDVYVRCGCLAYYHYFSHANMNSKCQYGGKFTQYTSKSKLPKNHPLRKPRNPKGIPGMCKHIVVLYTLLKERRRVSR